MSVYFAVTDQSKEANGNLDVYLGSHWPLNFQDEWKKYTSSNPQFDGFLMDKLQILLEVGDGIIFEGNLLHHIHGNSSDDTRISLFYVLQIEDDDIPIGYVAGDQEEVDYDDYNLSLIHI